MCFSITGFSDLFSDVFSDIKFVYYPSNSKLNFFRMTVNLIIWLITQMGYVILKMMKAIKFLQLGFQLIPRLRKIKINRL